MVLLTVDEVTHAVLGTPDGVDRRDYAAALKLELEAARLNAAGKLDEARAVEDAADAIWLKATASMLVRSGSLC